MNYIIDVIILLCLGWGAYKGFRKGFIIQSFAILSLILAIWAGFALSGYLEPWLGKHFNMSSTTNSVISFVLVFLLVLIIVYTSGYLVEKVVKVTTLGLINRLAGAAFGIFVNALILSIIIVMLNRINEHSNFLPKDKLEKSFLWGPVGKLAPAIYPKNFFDKAKDVLTP